MLGHFLAGILWALAPSPGGDAAEVVAEALEVLDAPDEAAFPTGRIRRGDRVVIRAEEPGGWLAIEPPAGSFSWIDLEALEDDPDGPDLFRVRITADAARTFVERAMRVVRSGRPPCPLCGNPLDPQGHICPRRNGQYVH